MQPMQPMQPKPTSGSHADRVSRRQCDRDSFNPATSERHHCNPMSTSTNQSAPSLPALTAPLLCLYWHMKVTTWPDRLGRKMIPISSDVRTTRSIHLSFAVGVWLKSIELALLHLCKPALAEHSDPGRLLCSSSSSPSPGASAARAVDLPPPPGHRSGSKY